MPFTPGRDLVPVAQPEGATCCGQCCCAALTGLSLQAVCREFGHSHSTYTREIVAFLRRHGFRCPDRLQRYRGETELPALCIVNLRYPGFRDSHVVVYHNGTVLDSCSPSRLMTLSAYSAPVHPTSFLPLEVAP